MEECRLCGSEEGFKVNIFEPESDFVRKIHKILPITINEHDPLPKIMCHRCSYKVNEFYEFRIKCIEAQEIFKRKLPWLRDKQPVVTHTSSTPMVMLPVNPMNSMSPDEKRGGQSLMDESASLVISDDDEVSTFKEETCIPNIFNGKVSQKNNCVKTKPREAPRRPRARCIWSTKKRKRKPQLGLKIAEVFTTSSMEMFQDNEGHFEDASGIENDPLYIAPIDTVENSKAVSYLSKDTRVEGVAKKKKTVPKKEEKTQEDISLPEYFLITKLPQGEYVYTCKECARTFVSSTGATNHVQESHIGRQNDRKREKKEEKVEPLTLYKCEVCGQAFSRHSQLITHGKKHYQADSSSDENSLPPSRRKPKPKSRRRKPKTKPLNNYDTSPPPIVAFEEASMDVTRHSLLSSESE